MRKRSRTLLTQLKRGTVSLAFQSYRMARKPGSKEEPTRQAPPRSEESHPPSCTWATLLKEQCAPAFVLQRVLKDSPAAKRAVTEL